MKPAIERLFFANPNRPKENRPWEVGRLQKKTQGSLDSCEGRRCQAGEMCGGARIIWPIIIVTYLSLPLPITPRPDSFYIKLTFH